MGYIARTTLWNQMKQKNCCTSRCIDKLNTYYVYKYKHNWPFSETNEYK